VEAPEKIKTKVMLVTHQTPTW